MTDSTRNRLDRLIGHSVLVLSTIVVGLTGWAARQMYADLRTHSTAIGQLQSSTEVAQKAISKLTSTSERAWRRIEDHDRRITRREDNAFTSRDASDLSMSVATLALQNAELSKDLEQTSAQLLEMKQDFHQLRETMVRTGSLAGE